MLTSRLNRLCCGLLLTISVAALANPSTAYGQPDTASPPPTEPAATAHESPAGLLPLPDYTGDFWSRSHLLGDLGGTRTYWANKGIQFDINFIQIMQSVVDGGLDTDTRYGGTLDYNLVLDLHRMGVMQGAIVKFRAESRYGESVNDISGLILPVNTDALFPFTKTIDDDIPFTITSLTYIQFLSEQFGILMGKIDTIDGDPNEFASGRGTSQFMNGNLVFPTSPALMAPYSTLAVGVIVMPVHGVSISSIVYNIADSSTTSGFEDFGEGTVWLTEAQFQYRLGELPGGQNVGFGYAFDADFTNLGRFVFAPGEGISASTKSESWSFYWSAWQYLFVEDPTDAPINLTNGVADHQGFGLFARFGFADEDTNPIKWAGSVGVGGKGILPSRDHDTYGIGYFYTSIQSDVLPDIVDIDDHSQGFEAFYNLAITPAAHLTFDVQLADSPRPNIDTAVILGMRLGLRF